MILTIARLIRGPKARMVTSREERKIIPQGFGVPFCDWKIRVANDLLLSFCIKDQTKRNHRHIPRTFFKEKCTYV